MGAIYSRVGSDNFYAAYERNFERLKADAARLKAKALESNRRRQRLSATIFWYSCVIFALLFAYAAWVSRRPPGTYSVRGHFLRVVPVFAWPLAAYVLHTVVMWLTSWNTRRNDARQRRCEDKMRKMLTDLKDSTHYDKTLQLLRKYDPEFAAAEARQRAKLRLLASPGQGPLPGTPVQAGVPASPRKLGGLVGSSIKGAGSRMMPALDYLATSLIGDNPALTNALREAHTEGEALKLRLQRAEARVAELNAINAELQQRLGEPPVPEASLSEPSTPTLAMAEPVPLPASPAGPSSAAPEGNVQDNNGSSPAQQPFSGVQPAARSVGAALPADAEEGEQPSVQHALSLNALLPEIDWQEPTASASAPDGRDPAGVAAVSEAKGSEQSKNSTGGTFEFSRPRG